MNQGTEPREIVIDKDLAVRVMLELGYLRTNYAETQVSRHNDRVEGCLTSAQIDKLEHEAYQRWNEHHPALKALWFDVLGARS